MKNILFFDENENNFQRFAARYPTAFHAWTAHDAIEWIINAIFDEEQIGAIDLLCLGYVPQETDILVSWIILNVTPISEIIIHTPNEKESNCITNRLRASGYDAISQRKFGQTWMVDKAITCC